MTKENTHKHTHTHIASVVWRGARYTSTPLMRLWWVSKSCQTQFTVICCVSTQKRSPAPVWLPLSSLYYYYYYYLYTRNIHRKSSHGHWAANAAGVLVFSSISFISLSPSREDRSYKYTAISFFETVYSFTCSIIVQGYSSELKVTQGPTLI